MENNENKQEIIVEGATNIETTPTTKNFFQRNFGKIAVVVIGSCFITGCAIGCNQSKKKGDSAKVKPTPVVTTVPTITPSVTPTVIPTVAPTLTPAPTPTPIVAEKVEVLGSENIEEVAKQLTESYNEKGLKVSVDIVKSALIVANIQDMDKEQLDIDIENEIKNANKFAEIITTNNIKAMYSNDVSKYVTVSELCYNETDKKIIEYLDEQSIWLLTSTKEGTLTEKKCSTSFDYVANFYEEKDSFDIDGEKLGYSDASCGGKFLSEMCSWPTLAVEYTICGKANKETLNKIKSVQHVAIDGIRYMTDLSICAKSKQLTK